MKQAIKRLEHSCLIQARTLAQWQHDFAEVEEIDAQLAELVTSSTDQLSNPQDAEDMLAKVNEHNQCTNMNAVCKAEIAEANRKLWECKLTAANGGMVVPVDPIAHLKIVPSRSSRRCSLSRTQCGGGHGMGICGVSRVLDGRGLGVR